MPLFIVVEFQIRQFYAAALQMPPNAEGEVHFQKKTLFLTVEKYVSKRKCPSRPSRSTFPKENAPPDRQEVRFQKKTPFPTIWNKIIKNQKSKIKNYALFFILHFSIFIFHSSLFTLHSQSRYISRIIEYKPAPGQFINQEGIGTLEAAESIVGGLDGIVSLGGFGGYIIVGFDRKIMNDPENPYGVDFTVVGNAIPTHAEPGVVMVMCENGCGQHNGIWYELKGSDHDNESTIRNYSITYNNPQSSEAADVPWTDNMGNSGVLRRVAAHGQSYYPLQENFSDYPQDEISFTGTLIDVDIDDSSPQFIRLLPLAWGYADNYPFTGTRPPYLPDNPATVGAQEGNGGDAFDISWAVDEDGKPVYLDGIDYIKIYTAANANAGWLGEVSTEVRAVIIVAPDDILSIPHLTDKPDISVYPNPSNDYVNVSFDNRDIERIEIWNTSGKLLYLNTEINGHSITIPVNDYPAGVYMVCVYERMRKMVKKLVISSQN